MAPGGKKLQKSTNCNITLDKESIVELIKAVLKEEISKTGAGYIKNYQQQRNYHETRNWKAKERGY